MNIKKQPSRISATQWGKTVTIEVEHSDTDLYEFMEMFKGVVVGLEYSESSWRSVIKELGELYTEEDADEEKFPNSVKNEFYDYVANLPEEYIDSALAQHNKDEEDLEDEL
jgi:ABC-type Fe2+-enterobactin transport system substrate-binding protein